MFILFFLCTLFRLIFVPFLAFRLFSSSVSTDSAPQSAQTAGDKRAQLTAANGAISSDSDKGSVASQGSSVAA
jgi:hypothetical protein